MDGLTMGPERGHRFPTSLCTVILLSLPVVSSAQMQFSFSGYCLNLPTVQTINEDLARPFGLNRRQTIDLTRARLRPTLELWDGAKIALEHEIVLQLHSAQDVFFLSPEGLQRQVVSLRWQPFLWDHGSLQHFVDRLYFRQNTESSSLVVGRQRIQWGTGRIWNPTDLFNPISPLNYAKIEKDGADAVSFTRYLGNFTDLELVYNPEDHFKRWNAGARFRTNVFGYDFSVVGGYFDTQGIVGGDFAGNLFTAGFRGEGIHRFANASTGRGYSRFILGVDYQFTSILYALVEYQYNGEGETDERRYDLIRLFRGEVLNVGRNYLAVSASLQAHPLIMVGVTATANLDDHSVSLLPTIDYSYSDAITFGAGGLITTGPAFTEFWYYPTSLYLQAQIFF